MLDTRHLMNELSERWGAAVVVAVREGTGFLVLAGNDLESCEQAAGQREILDSRIGS